MAQMNDQMEYEKHEIIKLRKNMKMDIQREMDRISGNDQLTKSELKRINAILKNNGLLLNLMLQDQMLMQLLEEQDVLDRKQMNLFGLKKNQQIIGTNQYGASNNLRSAPTQESSNQGDAKNFWELRNKNQKYS